jgi:hypothetical protein
MNLTNLQAIFTAFRQVIALAGACGNDLALSLSGDRSGDIAHLGHKTQPRYSDPESLNLTLWVDDQNGAATSALLVTYLRAVGGYDPDTLVDEAWDALNGHARRPAIFGAAAPEAGSFEALIEAYRLWITTGGVSEESTLTVSGSGVVVLNDNRANVTILNSTLTALMVTA